MPLHTQAQALLQSLITNGVQPFHVLSPEDCRRLFNGLLATLPASTAKIARSTERCIPGPTEPIPVRVYTPEGQGPFPILMYFHGGGWIAGDLNGFDATCRELCAGAGAVVVYVGYRLAPEYRFPAASDDCLAATRWVGQHAAEINGDPSRIAVSGDSAGGNLAAVIAQQIRDHGGPRLCAQLLVYPATDHVSSPMQSMIDNGEGYLLTRADMVYFLGHYLGADCDLNNPCACPLRAKSLIDLPPALVITGEFDPLRDEGEAYAMGLIKAGVMTTVKRYHGAIHGFFTFYAILDLGRQAMDDSCSWLKQRFA